MKKRIFIGSSLETKELAHQLQAVLSDRYECVLWYEGFFSLGSHFYTDLVQKIVTFDYAVMIGGPDDRVTRLSTGTEKTAPRDNVYLEYGLFSGILSPRRVLLLMHKTCVPASDLSGMSLAVYGDDADAIVRTAAWLCETDGGTGYRTIDRRDVGLLPTASVAVGYYYNFILPFTQKLTTGETAYPGRARLTVCVPDFVTRDVKEYEELLILRKRLQRREINRYRVLAEPSEENGLVLYDAPSTVLALFKTVDYVLGVTEGLSSDAELAKCRALDNFCEHLSVLLNESVLTKTLVRLERLSENEV